MFSSHKHVQRVSQGKFRLRDFCKRSTMLELGSNGGLSMLQVRCKTYRGHFYAIVGSSQPWSNKLTFAKTNFILMVTFFNLLRQITVPKP